MSHWYDKSGKLLASVPNKSKPGEYRDATLRDARPLKLYPSVTTILQELNKPMLNDWRVKIAVEEAFKYMIIPGMGVSQEVVKNVSNKSWEIAMEAADQGTTIHQLIESMLKSETLIRGTELQVEIAIAVVEFLDANGFKCTSPETTFVCEQYGYAGTIDFLGTYYDEPCVVDFKTQDALTVKDFNLYDEWPLQLAGYDIGYPYIEPSFNGIPLEIPRRRIEVIISRLIPGVILHHDYSKDREYDDAAFLSLVNFWQNKKRYFPHREEVILQEGLNI